MNQQVIYLNVYRAGVYHREGKPNTTNLHAGDIYTTERAALENAEPNRGYVTTIRSTIDVPEAMELVVNGPDSIPTPLSVTLRYPEQAMPYLVDRAVPMPETPSLEVGDGHYGVGYQEWRSLLAGKPVHGGYPE